MRELTFSVGSFVLLSSGKEERIKKHKVDGASSHPREPCAAVRQSRHRDGSHGETGKMRRKIRGFQTIEI